MRNLNLTIVPLGILLLVSGCGGGGGGSSSGGGTPAAAIQITTSNAPTVAKGAMTSAQTTTNTGSGMAGVVGVVVQSSTRSRSVREIALEGLARLGSLNITPSVAGAIQSHTTACSSGNFVTTVNDANNNNAFDGGDVVTYTFNACTIAGYVNNGSMSFSISSLSGTLGGTGTPSVPLTAGFTLSFNNYSSRQLATNLTDSFNGGISFSTSDNGTTTTGTMSGASLTGTSSVDGTFSMTNFSFVFTDASNPNITNAPYSFSAQMTVAVSDGTSIGSITVTTPTTFSGVGSGNPTAGQMVITGANSSTLTLTAQPDGVTVTMVVDEDGAAGPIAPVSLPDTTWTAI